MADDLAALRAQAEVATEAYHDAKLRYYCAEEDWRKAQNAYGYALMRAKAEEARA